MNVWTDNEIKCLKECYNKVTNEELQKLFPNKTFLSIYKKAYTLGLRKDTAISYLNRSIARKGKIKKTVTIGAKGYKKVYMPEHPRADRRGRVLEHIVVWERGNGKTVPEGCCVHHINEDKGDNRLENLRLMTKTEHITFHNTRRKISDETRQKMREKAMHRLKIKRNHPMYKSINILQMQQEISSGKTVEDVCRKYHICRTTYYKKLKEGDYANAQ